MTKTHLRIATAVAALACSALTQAAAPKLTPEQLQQLIECKNPLGGLNVAHAGVPWLVSVQGSGLPYEVLEVKKPVKVFGIEAKRIGVYRDWVFAEVPREQAMALAKAQNFYRLPAKSEETYGRHTRGDEGPMVGIFSTGSMIVFGLEASPAKQGAPSLVGCNYVASSRQELNAEIKQLGL